MSVDATKDPVEREQKIEKGILNALEGNPVVATFSTKRHKNNLAALLRNGVVLLHLAKLHDPSVNVDVSVSYDSSLLEFKITRNVKDYIEFCKREKFPPNTLFHPMDLGRCPLPAIVLDNVEFLIDKEIVPEEELIDAKSSLLKSSLRRTPTVSSDRSLSDFSSGEVVKQSEEMRVKQVLKYDTMLEDAIIDWIRQVLENPSLFPPAASFVDVISTGELLCDVFNKLQPGAISKIHRDTKLKYMQVENINNYLHACKRMGLKESEIFEPSSLVEKSNLPSVLANIRALAVTAALRGYTDHKIRDTSHSKSLLSSNFIKSKSEILFDYTDPPTEEELQIEDYEEIMEWANDQLADSGLEFFNLSRDASNGVKLITLCEKIFGINISEHVFRDPVALEQCVHNCDALLQFIAQRDGQFPAIATRDIMNGRAEKIVVLMSRLRAEVDRDYQFQLLMAAEGLEEQDIDVLYDEPVVEHFVVSYDDEIEQRVATIVQLSDSDLGSSDEKAVIVVDEEHKQIPARDTIPEPETTPEPEVNADDDAEGDHESKHDEERRHRQRARHERRKRSKLETIPLGEGHESKEGRESRDGHEGRRNRPKKKRKSGSKEDSESKSRSRNRSDSKGEDGVRSPRRSSKKHDKKRRPRKSVDISSLPVAQSVDNLGENTSMEGEISEKCLSANDLPLILESSTSQQVEEKKVEVEVESTEEISSSSSDDEKETSEQKPAEESKPEEESKEDSKPETVAETKTSVTLTVQPTTQSQLDHSSSGIISLSRSGSLSPLNRSRGPRSRPTSVHERAVLGRHQSKSSLNMNRMNRMSVANMNKMIKAKNKMLGKVAGELLQTEITYVKLISQMCEEILEKMDDTYERFRKSVEEGVPSAEFANCKPLSPNELRYIFANAQQIRNIHMGLLEKMKEIVREGASEVEIANYGPEIVNLFDEYITKFDVYSIYLNNYGASLYYLVYMREHNSILGNFIQEWEDKQQETTRLNLASYLVLPVQRLPRYSMLLGDIMKFTECDDATKAKYVHTVKNLQATLSELNAKIDPQREQSMLRLVNSLNTIHGVPNDDLLRGEDVHVVFEGTVKSIALARLSGTKGGTSEKVHKPGYILLTNDKIVFCQNATKGGRMVNRLLECVPISDISSVLSPKPDEVRISRNISSEELLQFRSDAESKKRKSTQAPALSFVITAPDLTEFHKVLLPMVTGKTTE